MKYLATLLTWLACNITPAAEPLIPSQHDGTWLQNGIKQYQRLNAHETLSDNEKTDAIAVASYVCAVVDLEQYLVERAALLSTALEGERKKQYLGPQILGGMTQTVSILVPLAKTAFLSDHLSCDRARAIVQDYLDQYPEMLPKDAAMIIERALMAAYTKTND